MCAALSYHGANYRSAADRAGLAGALVDAEMVLKIAAAVDPIDAGTIAADALLQDFPDGTVKFFNFSAG